MSTTWEQMRGRLERTENDVARADDRGYLNERYMAAKQAEVLVEIARALVSIAEDLSAIRTAGLP